MGRIAKALFFLLVLCPWTLFFWIVFLYLGSNSYPGLVLTGVTGFVFEHQKIAILYVIGSLLFFLWYLLRERRAQAIGFRPVPVVVRITNRRHARIYQAIQAIGRVLWTIR